MLIFIFGCHVEHKIVGIAHVFVTVAQSPIYDVLLEDRREYIANLSNIFKQYGHTNLHARFQFE
jgi:hypothetical protein